LNADWHRVAIDTVPAGVTTPIDDNLVDIHVELSGAADACLRGNTSRRLQRFRHRRDDSE